MAILLGRFEMPKRVVKEEKNSTNTYARFVAEPFEAGFGNTLGNSLRRVLLSSLEGAAITAAKIEGVQHEFTTIPGVVEDVVELRTNLELGAFRELEVLIDVPVEIALAVESQHVAAQPSKVAEQRLGESDALRIGRVALNGVRVQPGGRSR